MALKFQYTSIDSVLAKYHRDFRGLDIREGDAIEWIGEALGHMKSYDASEEVVTFLEVSNYMAEIPKGMHYIIQIARDNDWVKANPVSCTVDTIVEDIETECTDCNVNVCDECYEDCGESRIAHYAPKLTLQLTYNNFYNYYESRRMRFTPVRLANASFFNTLVCQLSMAECLNEECRDEYTIIQDYLRFNFKEGFVAIAYKRQMLDDKTGYPMVPDDESARAAIAYYLAWKFKEQECYNHREGACQLADRAEAKWLKYVKQFRSKAKMPRGLDDHQDLMEQSLYLIPRQKSYYGFFGKLNYPERRPGFGANLF